MSEGLVVERKALVLDLVSKYAELKRNVFFSKDRENALNTQLNDWVAEQNGEFEKQALDMIMTNAVPKEDGYVLSLPDYIKAKRLPGIEAFKWLMTKSNIFDGLNIKIHTHKTQDDVYFIEITE